MPRKQDFLEYTNDISTQSKNKPFLKGLTHHFNHKFEISCVSFSLKKGLDVLLDNILKRKQGFLGNTKDIFT